MNKISAKQPWSVADHHIAFRFTVTASIVASLFRFNTALAEPMFQPSIMPSPDYTLWTDNYVEIGVGAMETDSPNGKAYKFGEFTGVTEDGAFGIVGFNWIFQNQKDDSLYFRTHGQDLALETRKLSIEGGKQGAWAGSASAERLLRAELSPAKFIYDPATMGSDYLRNLQPRPSTGADAAAATSNLAAFFNNSANYTNFDIEQGRDIYKLGLRGILSTNWTTSVNYREDVRDGNRLTGLYFNTATPATAVTGGRQAVNVPYAIEDKTQQLDATLGYATKTMQGQLTYNYSRYENQLDRFKVDNPNQMLTGILAASTLPVAQMSLSPDNEYHQLTATAAYNFTKDTRAKAQFSYGIATQNDAFLPYNSAGTTTSTVSGVANTALPASLNGEVINTVADLMLLTKPLDAMSVKMGYQYRDIENNTPRVWVNYYSRDTTTAPAANGTSERRNAPASTTEQRAYVDGDYMIGERTQARALLEHSMIDYTFSDVSQTKTDKLQLDLRRTFSDEFLGNLGYIFTQRTGSEYDKNVYFRETYTSTYVGTGATQARLTNHPNMRPHMFNDYDENRVRALGNWTINEALTLGGSIDGFDRKYKGNDCNRSFAPTNFTLPETCLGTRKSMGGYANADLNWQPDENVSLFTFASIGHSETDIDQRQWLTSDVNPAAGIGFPLNNQQSDQTQLSDLSRNWSGKTTYTDQTVGVGAKWQLTSKWELGGQYVYSLGNGATEFTSAFSNPQSMPDTESTLHTLDLFAKLAYSSKLVIRFNYVYENLKVTDWSYDAYSASPTSTAGIVLTGQNSPKYENHVVGVSVAISAW